MGILTDNEIEARRQVANERQARIQREINGLNDAAEVNRLERKLAESRIARKIDDLTERSARRLAASSGRTSNEGGLLASWKGRAASVRSTTTEHT